jgi:CheY-like chemotaxis protein
LARKILLADDSVTAQNMGRKILADAGYDVVTVNNGSAALKRIAEIKPDLIVLDVYMPGYSGLEVCQRLKDAPETAHIPVLLTVGKLEPFKPDEARRVKADAHIVKPFEASELLTAITRLEDRMVPLQADGTRGEGSENSSTETGWKSRLRFPSKKKKEEPEPEDPATVGGTFRDFRKGKSKSFTGKAAAGQEPELVPDIPRDITPEELDVLSALAARLDGPAPAAENVAPLPDTTTTTTTTATTATATKTVADEAAAVEVAATQAAANEVAAGQVVVAEAGVEVATAAAVSADAKTETEAKVQDKTEVETPAHAAEAATFATEALSEVVIPAEHVELAAESAAVVADTVAAEANRLEGEPVENQHPETPAAVIAVGVNTALLAEDPAPVDRNDEPVFASSANAVEPTAQDKTEFRPAEAVAESHTVGAIETIQASEASALVDVVAAANPESQREPFHGEASPVEPSKSEASKTEESNAGELQAESPALPIAANLPEEAEETAPSDEELAQALSLLTPASAHADVSGVRAYETRAASGSRWIAEPAVLSREESEISLEAEMFRTFAAVAAAVPAAVPAAVLSAPMGPGTITGVSAIAAAVENRLAEAELAARTKASLGPGSSEPSSSEPGLPTGSEPSAVEARAEVMSAEVSDEASATGATPATLADAGSQRTVSQDRLSQDTGTSDATTEPAGESVRGAAEVLAPAPAAENQDSSSGVEEQESMGKDVKSKSGKSSWRQIRTAPVGTPASDAVETQEAPKAMAAAAAAEGASSSSSSAPDASTIASIVDSVMADLRPKIVEEIARKLAGK